MAVDHLVPLAAVWVAAKKSPEGDEEELDPKETSGESAVWPGRREGLVRPNTGVSHRCWNPVEPDSRVVCTETTVSNSSGVAENDARVF